MRAFFGEIGSDFPGFSAEFKQRLDVFECGGRRSPFGGIDFVAIEDVDIGGQPSCIEFKALKFILLTRREFESSKEPVESIADGFIGLAFVIAAAAKEEINESFAGVGALPSDEIAEDECPIRRRPMDFRFFFEIFP